MRLICCFVVNLFCCLSILLFCCFIILLYLLQALDEKAGHKDCLVLRSLCYLQLGELQSALRDADATLKDNKKYHKVRGRARERKRESVCDRDRERVRERVRE